MQPSAISVVTVGKPVARRRAMIDDGTRAMLELRRSTGYKRLAMALPLVTFAVYWINQGRKEGELGSLGVWAPVGILIAIAALIAVSGLAKIMNQQTE